MDGFSWRWAARRAAWALIWLLTLLVLAWAGLRVAGWLPGQQMPEQQTSAAPPAPGTSAPTTAAAPPSGAASSAPLAAPLPTSPAEPSPAPTRLPDPVPPDSALPERAPEPAAAVAPASGALALLNSLRAGAGVGAVQAEPGWQAGCAAHARYLVRADRAEHREDPASPFWSAAGEACAPGHYFVSSQPGSDLRRALSYWVGGAFHLPQLLDPRLTRVAFGEAHDAGGAFQSAAVLDVRRGLSAPDGQTYPVRYPGPESGLDLAVAPAGASASEWPDPLVHCGLNEAGAPVALLMGPGVTVRGASLKVNGQPVPACLLSAASFRGASAGDTQVGRGVLGAQGAGVLLPHAPLRAGDRVQVSFGTTAGRVGWTFGVR
ncbi:CAP domain-containing protein [Deinococcus aquaticus]|uniref:CAP domain-containing protein n=1 Tax=Deinococcus aquaticus TaxID=328692 RepID=UPI003F47E588